MITIDSKQIGLESLQKKYQNAIIADVTYTAKNYLVRLCPSFPHGGIPVPNSGFTTANSVEAIWQGLKIFESEDIATSLFSKENANELIRSSSQLGKMLGHRFGINGLEVLNYADARRRIFIRTYRWVLDYKVQDIIKWLRDATKSQTIVLLDNHINCDIYNYNEPLSHAYLVRAYVEGLPPYEDAFETITTHHYYAGRRVISWTTEERRVKTIKSCIMPQQLELSLDFKGEIL